MVADSARVLVVSSEYPNDRHPVSAGFVRDQSRLMADRYDVAVLVPRVAGWRQLASGHRWPGTTCTQEEGVPVFRTTAWLPPLRPAWFARRLLRPPPDARGGAGVSNSVLDLVIGRFRNAAENGYRVVARQWGTPDLIHAHFVLPGGWAGFLLARELGVPMVLTEHSSPFENQIETPLRRRLVRDTLVGADRVLAVSPNQADQIRAFEPTVEAEVVGNLIREDFFFPEPRGQSGPHARRFRFLSIAHLTRRKGIDDLLRAAARLSKMTDRDFEICIGGDGPDRDRLISMVDELDLEARTTFTGLLLPEEVRGELQRSDALVLPSHHESFGMVVGEAMACGTPVVATRCGGPEYLVEADTGLLVDVGDAPAMATAMKSLLTGEAVFDPAVVRARITERFGSTAFRKRLGSVYDDVMSARGAGTTITA